MPTFDDALRGVDDAFVTTAREKRIPGVAWGVIRDGRLAHAGGTGVTRDGGSAVPDADTVYRIASMTKSFTASAILLLRDEGRLRLDDPVADHVPALASWAPPTRDSGPITIRQLLTMTAGLPTDDPWGDRQQALPLDAFDALLRAGPVFAWPPGTAYDYSNLGYGMLGRVITSVAGAEYRDVVRERLMAPLGMTSSGFDEDEIPAERLAHGYARVGEDLVREGEDVYGALASMGGVYSTVRDLSRWVLGFLDAFPARDDPEGGHPLRRSSRREMQQSHLSWPVEVEGHPAHEAPVVEGGGYGYGLWAISRAGVGTIVGHGGGYPGYGTHMVWHPATGLGVIAAGNLRYAGVHPVAVEQLVALVAADGVVARRPRPLPRVDRGRLGRRTPARSLGRRGGRRVVRDEHGPRRAARAPPRGRGGGRGAGRRPVPRRRRSPARVRLGDAPAVVAARRARLAPMRAQAEPGAGAAHPGRSPSRRSSSRRRRLPPPERRSSGRRGPPGGPRGWRPGRPWIGRSSRAAWASSRGGSAPSSLARSWRATDPRPRPGSSSRRERAPRLAMGAPASSSRWTRHRVS